MSSSFFIKKKLKKKIQKDIKKRETIEEQINRLQNELNGCNNDIDDDILEFYQEVDKTTVISTLEFYDDLMNTEGLMQMNTVAKELEIGEYTLFAYLRGKKVFFYDKDKVNVPYERFRREGKFAVKETPCHDGQMRSVTYVTKKGLDYVRKLLRKDGYYNAEVA